MIGRIMIHLFHVLLGVFLSGNLVGMEPVTHIIPFLPYTIARSGSYTLAPCIQYKNTVRGDFFDAALRIHNGANVVLNLNNMTLDAHGKKYALDTRGAQSVFVYRGIVKNADTLVNCFYNNVQFMDVILLKYNTFMSNNISLPEYTLNQSVVHSFGSGELANSSNPQSSSAVIIKSLPCTILLSGTYYLSSDARERTAFKKKHFDCAIRMCNGANVVLNLNGHVLNAKGRTFGIDANGAKSIFVCNGTIKNADRAISSLNNNVCIKDICVDNCKYAAIETTEQRTNTNNLQYNNCGDEK